MFGKHTFKPILTILFKEKNKFLPNKALRNNNKKIFPFSLKNKRFPCIWEKKFKKYVACLKIQKVLHGFYNQFVKF